MRAPRFDIFSKPPARRGRRSATLVACMLLKTSLLRKLPRRTVVLFATLAFGSQLLFQTRPGFSPINPTAYSAASEVTKCSPPIILRYPRNEQASTFGVSLNVSHLEAKYHKSGGWLSQEEEDHYLHEHFFSGLKEGTFVELGALDGLRFSNTYIFEKAFNWRGLLIEAETENFFALERNRGQGKNAVTLHAAICAEEKLLKLYGTGPEASINRDSKMIKAGKVSWAPCLRMEDVLKRSGIDNIDFLSLDVEGAELETLETIDFGKTPTFVILVEMRKVDEGSNPKIRKHLHEHGFCRFADDVGHSNEVWINPKYQQRKKRAPVRLEPSETKHKENKVPAAPSSNFEMNQPAPVTQVCEDFLNMPSEKWMQLRSAYSGVRCDIHLGKRPPTHTLNLMGSTCEPWITRCAIGALDRILKPEMHGLEWSCGSGTLWYIQRLASLTSIEHDEQFFRECRERVTQFGQSIEQRWTGKNVPFIEKYENNTATDEKNSLGILEGYEKYVQQALHLDRKKFDFIVIDGRSRSACLRLIIRERLLKALGGILVLDNAERDTYQDAIREVPSHWPRYDFSTPVDTTTIWISEN